MPGVQRMETAHTGGLLHVFRALLSPPSSLTADRKVFVSHALRCAKEYGPSVPDHTRQTPPYLLFYSIRRPLHLDCLPALPARKAELSVFLLPLFVYPSNACLSFFCLFNYVPCLCPSLPPCLFLFVILVWFWALRNSASAAEGNSDMAAAAASAGNSEADYSGGSGASEGAAMAPKATVGLRMVSVGINRAFGCAGLVFFIRRFRLLFFVCVKLGRAMLLVFWSVGAVCCPIFLLSRQEFLLWVKMNRTGPLFIGRTHYEGRWAATKLFF